MTDAADREAEAGVAEREGLADEARALNEELEARRLASTKPSGVDLIAAERARQVDVEGWTGEHDDDHDGMALNYAAQAYCQEALDPGTWPAVEAPGGHLPPPTWPWEVEWWKPSDDPVRNLVKAGALIAAEIDRLQRAGVGS